MKAKNKVVVITGGGTGIGRATAELFAREGAKIVVCGRRSQLLSATVQSVQKSGSEALAIATDVRDWTEVNNMVNTILDKFGNVDVLINNAGTGVRKSIVETTQNEWDEIVDTNLKGTFLCCKAILPYMMREMKGIIINISSTFGITGVCNFGAYCASKFGIIGLTQALSQEVREKGIKVFAVCPGGTYTDLHSRFAGEDVAKLSMSARQVAARIVDLATGRILLNSGGMLVVKKKSFFIFKRIKGLLSETKHLLWLR